MAVKVTHQSKQSAVEVVTSDYDVESWTIDNKGNLTVGDSLGNSEVSFAGGFWYIVEKVHDDFDEDGDED